MRAVTSFGPAGWELYAKRFLETYCQHVDMPIDVYIEGDEIPQFAHEKVTYRNLWAVDGALQFMRMSDFPAARGHEWGDLSKRNYRYDVNRFSRKSFAQIDAAKRVPSGMLFWIDADVVFSDKFDPPTEFECMAYLGRPEWHSCASFVGWNLDRPEARAFMEHYRRLYRDGDVFRLPEWHDSYVLDWIRGQSKIPARNLAEGLDLVGPANVFDAVFAPAARHLKGALKFKDVN